MTLVIRMERGEEGWGGEGGWRGGGKREREKERERGDFL